MRVNPKNSILATIAILGLCLFAAGLTASIVPSILPSLGVATLIIGIATTYLAIAATRQEYDSTQSAALQKREDEDHDAQLQAAYEELLEDKTFLQFSKADEQRDRQIIAYDLHETVFPRLTSALFRLEKTQAEGDPTHQQTGDAIRLVRSSLNHTRRVMNLLSPSLVYDEGVVSSLQRLVDQLETRVETVEFHHDIDFDRLTPYSECALVRIVREAFHLIACYRNATQTVLELLQENDRLLLRVFDNGVCDMLRDEEVAGSQQISHCVDLFSGQCEIEYQAGVGTTLAIELSVSDLMQSDIPAEKSPVIG
ncbi:hypothetical protein GC197_17885 [bacterium]|nr:hypothetical protein [bacterium]